MSIPSWAHVGAKVVCIKAAKWTLHGPSVGEVCSISGVKVDEKGGWLYLAGYSSWVRTGPSQEARVSYNVEGFRPLITLEDDMAAHFTRLLDVPAPTERERA